MLAVTIHIESCALLPLRPLSCSQAALAHIESIIYNPFEPKEEQLEDAEEVHSGGATQPSEKSKDDTPQKDG